MAGADKIGIQENNSIRLDRQEKMGAGEMGQGASFDESLFEIIETYDKIVARALQI